MACALAFFASGAVAERAKPVDGELRLSSAVDVLWQAEGAERRVVAGSSRPTA